MQMEEKDSKVVFSENKEDLLYCPKDFVHYEIPIGIKRIGKDAFADCRSLQSVSIPDTVKSIGENAFYHCSSLESVFMPDSISDIGEHAFDLCTSLRKVRLSNSIRYIRREAFRECKSLHSIIIPSTVVEIQEKAFKHCKNMQSVVISESEQEADSLKTIRYEAFRCCEKLEEIVIPDTVHEIESGTFAGCSSLKRVTVSSVWMKQKENVVVVERLGKVWFRQNVNVVIYPDSFAGCNNLREIDFDTELRVRILSNAFSGSTEIKHVKGRTGMLVYSDDAFVNKDSINFVFEECF